MDPRRILAAVAVIAVFAAGCFRALGTRGESAHQFLEAAAIAPPTNAVLDYGGAKVQVSLKTIKTPDEIEIQSIDSGEVLESEVYGITPGTVTLKQAAGDSFVPPLPLLTDSASIGTSTTWKGEVVTGGLNHTATATVVTHAQDYIFRGLPKSSVKVDVSLQLANGSPTPALRQLNFVIVSGNGILQREFGAGVKRTSVDDDGAH